LVIIAALVATSVYVGVQLFSRNAVDASRDALVVEMKDLAGESLKHFRKPVFLGGGGKSFEKLDKMKRKNSKSRAKKEKKGTKGKPGAEPIGTQIWETEVGTYSVVIAAQDSAVIDGVGELIGLDGKNPVAMRLVVKQHSRYFTILN
jgi:hypothetical protein